MTKTIHQMVEESAIRHFREGHNMAGSFYNISEELGALYVATQRWMMQCPDCGVSQGFGYDPKSGICHNHGCCGRGYNH